MHNLVWMEEMSSLWEAIFWWIEHNFDWSLIVEIEIGVKI